jgi:hypothetical protein
MMLYTKLLLNFFLTLFHRQFSSDILQINFSILRLGYLRNDHKIIARSVVNSIPRADPFTIAENFFITMKQSSLQKRVSKKVPNFLSRLTVEAVEGNITHLIYFVPLVS